MGTIFCIRFHLILKDMNEDICIICMENINFVQFIPCEHCIVCVRCVHLLESDKCPLCRSIVKEVSYNSLNDTIVSTEQDATCLDKEQLTCFQRKKEAVQLSLKLIQEQRQMIEDLVRSLTFHIVVCGLQEKDICSLSLSLQLLYPVVSECNIMQKVINELCCTETFLWFISQSQSFYILFQQGRFKNILEWLCPNISMWMPNMEIDSYPIHLETVSFSQLEYLPPSNSCPFADVFVLCIDARSKDSLWKTLLVDEQIRKWKRNQPRIWLIQHYDAIECQYEPQAVQRAQVEWIYRKMRPCERPVDMLFMKGEGIFKMWLREVAFQMLVAAKGVRRLCKCKQESKICQCM
ncbi:hypothetical protein GpartN1_g2131.t1 [Galdieria partita]|uniref:RING-type domain-containing protein n=1 Tax=Galdieria partita TaxID=83374 RepID=A0A9C7PTU6_9RHOD|nr:hypothetical protein GpartN1_g2131.t1 [Galdieria partita]